MLKSITTLSCTALALAALSSPVSAESFEHSPEATSHERCFSERDSLLHRNFDKFNKKYNFSEDSYFEYNFAKRHYTELSNTIAKDATTTYPGEEIRHVVFKEGIEVYYAKNSNSNKQMTLYVVINGPSFIFADKIKVGVSQQTVLETLGKECLGGSSTDKLSYLLDESDGTVEFNFKNNKLTSINYNLLF